MPELAAPRRDPADASKPARSPATSSNRSESAETAAGQKRTAQKVRPRQRVSLEDVRSAVYSLLELAVAYESSEGSEDFDDFGFGAVLDVVGATKGLRDVIKSMRRTSGARWEYTTALRVAQWLPTLTSWLKEPNLVPHDDGQVVSEVHLREQIVLGFLRLGVPLPPRVLDELIEDFTRFSKKGSGRVLKNNLAKETGTLQVKVASKLAERGVLKPRQATLFKMRSALEGRRQATGHVKEPSQARTLLSFGSATRTDLVRYVLKLVMHGGNAQLLAEATTAIDSAFQKNEQADMALLGEHGWPHLPNMSIADDLAKTLAEAERYAASERSDPRDGESEPGDVKG